MADELARDGLPTADGLTATNRLLGIVGCCEAGTLLVLIANIFLGHNAHIAQIVGPVHGLLYLTGIALAWRASRRGLIRALAVLPVVGALLAFRLSRRAVTGPIA